MSAEARTRVFIDASVWIAATGSPTGGSSLVLDVCRGMRYVAFCSQRVLLEAQTNIRDKFPAEALVRFYRLLAATAPEIVPPATPGQEAQYDRLVTAKDAHVIAAALHDRTQYLITLDRKHLANEAVRGAGLPFQVMLPGEFLQAQYRKTRFVTPSLHSGQALSGLAP
ncbi:MAG: PIN domain-containing protein [Chloroflexi bacterium]|nr:PIN domain-containing protein [Chloroflexota bacterium]